MLRLPTGPRYKTNSSGERALYEGGSAQEDYNSYSNAIKNWRESAREEAFQTANLSPEINAVGRYVQCLQGEWWDKKRARYKSRFFDNRMDNARQSDLALLTDTRPTIDVSCAIDAYKEQCQVVQNCIHDVWTRNDYDLSLVSVTDITKLNGTGFWKIGAALPGNMNVVPCGPEQVMPIQPGFHIQDSTAVMYKTWKGLSYYRNKFPWAYTGLENEADFLQQSSGGQSSFVRPSEIPEYTWNGLAPQMRRIIGIRQEASEITQNPFKTVELNEYYVDDPAINESEFPVLMRHPYLPLEAHNYWYWVKPGQRLYPRKRLIVFGGRKLMYDGPAPFWHGLYPFACMRLNPVPWSFWGLSKYRDLLPINAAMNEIGAGVMDMIKRALSPVAVTKAGPVPLASWNNFYPEMPGARLYMMPNANPGTDIRYMDPPNIPAWVLTFFQYLTGEFDRLAGIMDPTKLGGKKQVPGGDTIEQMRDLMNSTTRLEGRYMEAFLRDAGMQAVSNVFQFYELPIRLRLLGKDGQTMEDYAYNGPTMIPDNIPKEDHWRNFSFTITPGTLLNPNKDRDKQIAMSLGSKHIIPLTLMYEKIGIGNPQQVFAELVKEQQALAPTLGHKPGGGGSRTTRGQRNGQAA